MHYLRFYFCYADPLSLPLLEMCVCRAVGKHFLWGVVLALQR